MVINLSLKYWKKHKKRAFAVIFAIAVSMAALICSTFLARSSSTAYFESQLDLSGNYDVIFPNIDADQLELYKNDERFSAAGSLYRSGKIFSSNGREFYYGALDEPAIDLYHFTPVKGRYPQKSGEITACRSFFEANGCYPEIGDQLSLTLYDQDDLLFKECDFTVVGILDDKINRVLAEKDNYIFPQVFLSVEDIPQSSCRDLMANYNLSADIKQIKEEFIEKKTDYYEGGRIQMMNTIALVPITEMSEKELYSALGNAHKDFYAYALIPVFSSVVLFVAFVSICNAVSTSLSERKQQFAMLRCIGMSKSKVMKISLAESFFMVVIGMIIGFALGSAAYILILAIQSKLLNLNVYPAFSVNPVIEATTVNPYIFSSAACFICSFLAIILPYLLLLRKSPTEGLRNDKRIVGKRLFRMKNKSSLLGKLSGGLSQNFSLFVIIVAVVWSSVFGYSYFSAQSDTDNKIYKSMLENSRLMGVDHLAERNFDAANCGNAQLNHHGSGISPELAEKIAAHSAVKNFFACIEAKSTKLILKSNEINSETLSSISSLNLENGVQNGIEELYEKSLKTQGYLDNEILFNIPTIGVSDKDIDFLAKYLVDGNINTEKLRSGEEVLILRTSGSDPFSVGQTVSMTDVVIDDKAIEEYDFSTGYVPDGYEPNFYYDYTDNPDMVHMPGYAFGTRCDYNVTIGGHIEIYDEDIANFFQTDSLIGDCGFNILCSEKAFSQWGLPDRNYTKLGVSLEDNANNEDFEKLWYNVIGNSRDVNSTTQSSILRQMNSTETTNMSIFFAIITIVIILGLVGIFNSINLRIRRQQRTYSVLRAVGFSKVNLVSMILKQGLIYVVIGSITSFIPLWIFEMFRKEAVEYSAAAMAPITSENGRFNLPWQSLFPRYIELFDQPVILIILAVFLIVCFIMLISNIIPTVWIVKKNITEALKNDDF